VLGIGSHIDSVRNAGRYDGCLGVAMGIALAGRIGPHVLPYDLEIRAFGDEEGVRFPVTLTSVHATCGSFDPAWLQATDRDGITLHQALIDFGLDPTALVRGDCTAKYFAYLEIHIEQGPVLEWRDAPLGVVTAINGAIRYQVTVTGQAGHAGTIPMGHRRDALAAASAMVLAIEAAASRQPNAVATVGRLSVAPDVANVIPGSCAFTIDLRAPDDTLRAAVAAEIIAALADIAAARHVTVSTHPIHQAAAAACDPRLQESLAEALRSLPVPVIHLPSGAGHDAMVMAAACPMAMLFLRCAGGLSHHPAEMVSQGDVAAALAAMTHLLGVLDPSVFAK
jgi:allantoate deiminase